MWTSRAKSLSSGRAIKFAIDRGSSPVSYADVLTRWQEDAGFRTFFIGLLADSPFTAFRWETPPISIGTARRPFEFVLLDSPDLACQSNPSAFAEYFAAADPGGVVEFASLDHDAILIVPCPENSSSDYGHLAAYLRHASKAQQQALWELVGAAMQRRLSRNPVWLSTAGGGVPWVHVRLDDRPKYYAYAPYRDVA
ncbi:MAG: hypothetical protein KJO76_01230 [Gammaproteobacteria bacterium]|nr:hypothetical protein [Gammaproteobacteria bacterium]MBT8445407.1 hypothetical protein [Gammaproteobacteria bacterium]NND36173.1 hypothetical protein [Gammaproteobacteria bacterium]